MGVGRARAIVLVTFVAACGSGSDEGLYAKGTGGGPSGGTAGAGASGGGSAGASGSGGTAGAGAGAAGAGGVPSEDASAGMPGVSGAAGVAQGGGVNDAGPDGNDPIACPQDMPATGSPCNVLVNHADCVYGIEHCVCTVSSWLCVP